MIRVATIGVTLTRATVLSVLRVPPDGWLLRDLTCRGDELDGLLGYIQGDETGFEAVWLAPAPSTERFDALAPAIRAARLRCGGRRGPGQ